MENKKSFFIGLVVGLCAFIGFFVGYYIKMKSFSETLERQSRTISIQQDQIESLEETVYSHFPRKSSYKVSPEKAEKWN